MPEKHHMIPISLYWPDDKSNIIELEHTTHTDLHKILNIPTNKYSKRTRQFKKVTNGKTIIAPDDIDMIHDIQSVFFSNIHKLPKEVQKKHLQQIQEYMKREMQRALKAWADTINTPNAKFDTIHKTANEYKKEKHRIVIDKLKKIY